MGFVLGIRPYFSYNFDENVMLITKKVNGFRSRYKAIFYNFDENVMLISKKVNGFG